MTRQIHPDVVEVVYSEEQIRERVKELAAQINRDYAGRKLLVVTTLKGACLFMSDLVRELDLDIELDFMVASSYGSSTKSSGEVRILKDLDRSIEGIDVLVVEDILDTGLTLKHLLAELKSRGPASVEVAVFLRKDLGNVPVIEPRYLGFVCPNRFLVGYGLDYDQRYRQLPYVGVLDPRVYS